MMEKTEHTLVCLSPSPANLNTIYAASTVANAFKGRFTALYVENSQLSEEDTKRLEKHLKTAEKLGAEIVTTHGEDVILQISEYATKSKVTRIVIGQKMEKRKHPFSRTFTEKIIRNNPDIAIYVVPDTVEDSNRYKQKNFILRQEEITIKDLFISCLLLVGCTLLGLLFFHLGLTDANIIMIYLLGVLVTSILTSGYVWSILFSFTSVIVFNYFMTEPRLSLYAYGSKYPVTFAIMLIGSILTGTLASKLKDHAKLSAQSAFRTQILFDTNQLLQKASNDSEIIEITCNQLSSLLDRSIVAYKVVDNALSTGFLFSSKKKEDAFLLDDEEAKVAEWVLENQKRAGASTTHFSDAKCLYLAIRIGGKAYGVVGIPMQESLLDAFSYSVVLSMLGECALALDNIKNAKEKEEAAIRAENEQLRADLLRTISHDLRTPLTSISGNASTLLSLGDKIDEQTKKQIYTDIYDDAEWLNTVVENLLSVTRLNDGKLKIQLSDQIVEDVVEEALKHISHKKCEHTIVKKYDDTILLAKMDARLIIQVMINLVNNAIKYTPAGSTIEIETKKEGNKIVVAVKDNGPGIEEEAKPHIFEMFYTGKNKIVDSQRSLGLGLSLCKSIINAHGGTLTLQDNKPHGCNFLFTLDASEVQINE